MGDVVKFIRVDAEIRASTVVVYDGQCPFCSRFADYLAVRKRIRSIKLLDARGWPELVDICRRSGVDLNDGFLVIEGNQLYVGAAGMRILGLRTQEGGTKASMLRVFLLPPALANVAYALLSHGRKIVLRLLGRPLL